MGLVRKILIFAVLTAGLIALGRLAGRFLPRPPVPSAGPRSAAEAGDSGALRDSTNALPPVEADTTGGRWHERLFDPLERANGLGPKSLKRKPGFYEIALPKGKPIHEYALEIEKTCRARGITVVQGAELHPAGKSVEYLLESNGQRIKLRATLGASVMAGAARLAVVFTGLDSLTSAQAEALRSAGWAKSLVIDPYNPNPALRSLRDGDGRDGILIELPMEPSAYPYIDPGKHALYIHHGKEDVDRILGEALDSLPKAEGFASRYGDRAIENQPLLDKLFQFTAKRKLIFLDLTGSPRSLARQAAAAEGARSRSPSLFRDSARVDEELARKATFAQKSGEAVLALPYSETAFRKLAKAIDANAARFNEMGLELVDLASLSAPDTGLAAGNAAADRNGSAEGKGAATAGAKPAAKPAPGKPAPAKAPGKGAGKAPGAASGKRGSDPAGAKTPARGSGGSKSGSPAKPAPHGKAGPRAGAAKAGAAKPAVKPAATAE